MSPETFEIRQAARAEILSATEAVRKACPDAFARAEEETTRRLRTVVAPRRTLSAAIVGAFERARGAVFG